MNFRRVRLAAMIGAILALLAALTVSAGLVPIPASSGHWALTHWLLHFAMHRSVATHSLGIEVPPLDDPQLVYLGAGHYEGGCRFCHGAPGERLPRVPQASTPAAPILGAALRDYDDAELFYIVRHGIKFTGMPAWPAAQRSDEVWALVAFLRVLPTLDRARYRALLDGDVQHDAATPAIVRTACARCHGSDGLGRGLAMVPLLAGQKEGYLRDSMEAYAAGRRHSGIMEPIAAALDAEQLRTSVSWYATRPTRFTRSPPAPPNERIPVCSECHAEGAHQNQAYPLISGQNEAYLMQQLQLLAEGRRGGGPHLPLMQKVVHWLEPADRRALSEHFARAR